MAPLLLWFCLLFLTVLSGGVQASSDDVDGFDDAIETTLNKRVTETTSLNPFQVEVFVSYCAA